ncbi:MAG TPA: TonB-dependent receptor plug domain-containing protein [Bacteroidales bacterium]|nr:TonB-dependent receptor plug domain-containing protein [Bacteroidales bacterium]
MCTLITKRFIFTVIGLIVFFPGSSQSNPDETPERPVKVLHQFEAEFPQHKLFMHLDRREFVAGETIWLKAYLISGGTHEPLPGKQRVNLELVNVHNQVVKAAFIRTDNGFATGYLELPDSLHEGNYLVRAYTEWMKNFDENLFYHQEIFVHSPIEAVVSNQRLLRKNQRFNQRLADLEKSMQFYFFPEGGHLVAGLDNRVAFRATDGKGNGVRVEGRLYGPDGKEVISFRSDNSGMGVFTINPSPGVEYHANIKFEGGPDKMVDFPKALYSGYSLKADLQDEQLLLEVNRNFDIVTPVATSEILLLIHARSKVFFVTRGNLAERTITISVPIEILPTGISQVVLFDANNMPLAERLVFVNHYDVNEVVIDVFELAVQPPTGFEINVNLDFGVLQGGSGGFSMAVTTLADGTNPETSTSNIATNLLLTSDLRNPVSTPLLFLSGRTPEQRKTMDLIMMTNSWNRFNWNDLVRNNFPEINFRQTDKLTISGRVFSPERRTFRDEVIVNMLKTDARPISFSATSDLEGNFTFENLSFTGILPVELSATSFPEAPRSEIMLFSMTPETVKFPISPETRHHPVNGRATQKIRGPYADVAFHSVQRTSREFRKEQGGMATPDQVIYIREETMQRFRTVFDVLRVKVSGLTISGGQIMLRGPTSIRGRSEPLFGVDGSFTSRDHLFNIRTNEVSRIEIFKGPSASIFGVRGANGVIMVHSRTGEEAFPVKARYQIMGFQPEIEFSESLPMRLENNRLAPDKTLKWITDIYPDEKGTASLWLNFDHKPENLRILIQGVDQAGNLFFGERILTL